jgi:hypothetical protein
MSIRIIDQQVAFAEAYVAGSGSATQAAIAAGYSSVSARQTASRLLATPHVQEAIRREQRRVLGNRLASKALGVLEKILDDDGAPAGVRVDAAKTILDRAGMAAYRTAEPVEQGDLPLAQMTAAELERMARGIQHKLARLTALDGEGLAEAFHQPT